MSKSRNDVWGDPFEFEGAATTTENDWEPYEEQDASKYLEEAHEALSRFVNKTKKRGKDVTKPAKRGESWQ